MWLKEKLSEWVCGRMRRVACGAFAYGTITTCVATYIAHAASLGGLASSVVGVVLALPFWPMMHYLHGENSVKMRWDIFSVGMLGLVAGGVYATMTLDFIL